MAKTFAQLTPAQQKKAIGKCLDGLLTDILAHGLRFDDSRNADDLQARIDAAIQKADVMQMPWFAHEYILDTCREELEAMARSEAEDAVYPEASEHYIDGIAS